MRRYYHSSKRTEAEEKAIKRRDNILIFLGMIFALIFSGLLFKGFFQDIFNEYADKKNYEEDTNAYYEINGDTYKIDFHPFHTDYIGENELDEYVRNLTVSDVTKYLDNYPADAVRIVAKSEVYNDKAALGIYHTEKSGWRSIYEITGSVYISKSYIDSKEADICKIAKDIHYENEKFSSLGSIVIDFVLLTICYLITALLIFGVYVFLIFGVFHIG